MFSTPFEAFSFIPLAGSLIVGLGWVSSILMPFIVLGKLHDRSRELVLLIRL